MFNDAIEALGNALADVAGEIVQYTSSATGATASPVAVPERSTIEDVQSDGTIIQIRSHDWTVRARELRSGGQPIIPAKGDTITRTTPDGRQEIYELMSPPFNPADHLGLRLRLHSVLISANA